MFSTRVPKNLYNRLVERFIPEETNLLRGNELKEQFFFTNYWSHSMFFSRDEIWIEWKNSAKGALLQIIFRRSLRRKWKARTSAIVDNFLSRGISIFRFCFARLSWESSWQASENTTWTDLQSFIQPSHRSIIHEHRRGISNRVDHLWNLARDSTRKYNKRVLFHVSKFRSRPLIFNCILRKSSPL